MHKSKLALTAKPPKSYVLCHLLFSICFKSLKFGKKACNLTFSLNGRSFASQYIRKKNWLCSTTCMNFWISCLSPNAADFRQIATITNGEKTVRPRLRRWGGKLRARLLQLVRRGTLATHSPLITPEPSILKLDAIGSHLLWVGVEGLRAAILFWWTTRK